MGNLCRSPLFIPERMTDDKAPTRELLAHFDTAHRQKFGVPAYIVGGKHAKMLAEIWKLYGTARLEQLMDVFFEGNDFADDCGYSIEVFRSQVPRTLMQIVRREDHEQRIDWRFECQRLHQGRCGNPVMHAAEMTKAS